MRNYAEVTGGKCTTAKCADMWRKFNGGNTAKPDWTVCTAVYYTWGRDPWGRGRASGI
jgi:hypothetical protein